MELYRLVGEKFFKTIREKVEQTRGSPYVFLAYDERYEGKFSQKTFSAYLVFDGEKIEGTEKTGNVCKNRLYVTEKKPNEKRDKDLSKLLRMAIQKQEALA